ncbi:Anaerobic benzoate catabolism transcriptional regulator, partial [Dysosmobacter welbionis]
MAPAEPDSLIRRPVGPASSCLICGAPVLLHHRPILRHLPEEGAVRVRLYLVQKGLQQHRLGLSGGLFGGQMPV